jgi:hypothetical protein
MTTNKRGGAKLADVSRLPTSERLIEVFEWKSGEPRPGTRDKHRNTCLDVLEIPPDGQIPAAGDVILMNDPLLRVPSLPTRFRVIEREFLWGRMSADDKRQRWLKMWIHVRRLEDETK